MQSYEYRVVPAPRRAARVKGTRKPQDRFARTVEGEMNRLAQEGWEYVRSDTLPREQKSGWFSRPVTVFETVLVFRRALSTAEDLRQGDDLRHASAAMPPPVALTPPAFVAAPSVAEEPPPGPSVAAPSRTTPAASRFTPVPSASRAANLGDAAPVPPPMPTLTLVEPVGEPVGEPGGEPVAKSAANPRHAAE